MSNDRDELSDENAFHFTGFVCTTPEKTLTGKGGAQLKFYVKTVKTWRDRDGNPHNEAADIPVKLFGKAADAAGWVTMGSRVEVSGRIGSYSYQGQPPTLQFSFPSVKAIGTVGPVAPEAAPSSERPSEASAMPDRSPQPVAVDTTDTAGDDSIPF